MMETLLAVAVHHSDGRVGTVSLPLPNMPPTCPVLSPCLPADTSLCGSSTAALAAALALSTFVGIPRLLLFQSCCFFFCKFIFSCLFPLSHLAFQLSLWALPKSFLESPQPKGTREGPPYGCPQAHACGGMWRATHAEISLSFVEIWLLV